ncbi:helix-turn-helix domain-containing protein [Mycobacterium syngnathidarum]
MTDMGQPRPVRRVGPITDDELRKVGAQRRLAAHRELVVIVAAALAGRTQTAIAELLGVSQPHVSRTIAAVTRENNGVLRVPPTSVLDIVDERDAGEIDTDTMLEVLSELDYTQGYVPEMNGVPTDTYVRGSWDDIEFAYQQEKLTDQEYEQLFRAGHAREDTAAGIR